MCTLVLRPISVRMNLSLGQKTEGQRLVGLFQFTSIPETLLCTCYTLDPGFVSGWLCVHG